MMFFPGEDVGALISRGIELAMENSFEAMWMATSIKIEQECVPTDKGSESLLIVVVGSEQWRDLLKAFCHQ